MTTAKADSEPLAYETIVARCDALLAPYAMHNAKTAGRKHPEPLHPYRGPFQRDRDRIVHSAAYRRLSDKTQVFTGKMGDYHRTRLTHTLEVATVSRTLGRALRLNEDLVEALALAHDLGHPPFGHAGEDVLDECLADDGGFSHNRQALRIVEELERRYPDFPGLNLSIEILEGQRSRADHNAPQPRPLLEVQVVEAADSVAYNTHDADDALELGLLSFEQLSEVPLWREATRRVKARYRVLDPGDLKRAVLHELIDWQVGDLLAGALRRIDQLQVNSVAAVQQAEPLLGAAVDLAGQKLELERFLHERVYRHRRVLKLRNKVQGQLRTMFEGYVGKPELMPASYRARIEQAGLKRTVADYLAGMTDRYAQQEFRRLFAG